MVVKRENEERGGKHRTMWLTLAQLSTVERHTLYMLLLVPSEHRYVVLLATNTYMRKMNTYGREKLPQPMHM